MTKEMRQKSFKLKSGYRHFKRYGALDDALQLFLYMQSHYRQWFSTTDIIDFMEWDCNLATRKRVNRLGYGFVRIGRFENKIVHVGSPERKENMWRILE